MVCDVTRQEDVVTFTHRSHVCLSDPYTAGMRPEDASPLPSPFSAIPEAEWVCTNELAFAIFDSYPVSPGHVHVIPRYAGDMPDPRGGVRFV